MFTSPQHLIIGCCHAIYRDGDPYEDRSWILLPYQANHARLFVEHAQRFVELVEKDDEALGILAGGETRMGASLAESQSYLRVIQYFDYWGAVRARERITTELFSEDSLTNLLYSLGRYYEVAGRLPQRVTCLSFAFKGDRLRHHWAALGLTGIDFQFHGVNDPPDLEHARECEARVCRLFADDPLATGPALSAKRANRNPYRRRHGYHDPESPLAEIFARQAASAIAWEQNAAPAKPR